MLWDDCCLPHLLIQGGGPAWVFLEPAAVRDDLESLARDRALPILRIKAYEELCHSCKVPYNSDPDEEIEMRLNLLENKNRIETKAEKVAKGSKVKNRMENNNHDENNVDDKSEASDKEDREKPGKSCI